MAATPARQQEGPSTRAVVRVVAIVIASALAVYIVYRLRTPISYVLLAAFIAAAASGPVNRLNRRMPRGAAIAIVYAGIVLTPLAIGAIGPSTKYR